jgi:TPR repeat protein
MHVTNDSDNVNISNSYNLSHKELSQFKKNFNKINIKETEPATQNINEGDLSIVIDELVNFYFKMANEGKEENVRKQHVLDYIDNLKINLQEIYYWLLNNQNDSNSVYLLGYFNYYGIETDVNKQETLVFYQKAAELDNYVAQYNLAKMYLDGDGVEMNHVKVFELSKKLAEKEYLAGINRLGYCYDCGIGTNINTQKALELYQKGANLGNSIAQYNVALMYEFGKGIEKDLNLAIHWYQKSAEQGDKYSKTRLSYLICIN